MGDRESLLEDRYCPPIDPALFFALLSDYDLTDETSYDRLCSTLEVLKNSASADESANFDPSGSTETQHGDVNTSSSLFSERARSWHGDLETSSETTEDTDFSQVLEGIDRADLGKRDVVKHGVEEAQIEPKTRDLLPEAKRNMLQEMFPEAEVFDISFILKKTGNSFSGAVENLLNQAFLKEESKNGGDQIWKRGIDGFYQPDTLPRGRRTKGRKKPLGRRTSSTPAPLDDETCKDTVSSGRWDKSKADVEFITHRTFISPTIVTSTYHENRASLSATMAALCFSQKVENPYLASLEPLLVESLTVKLANEFPALPQGQLKALIQLTYPSTSSAHELACALFTPSSSESQGMIVPHYLPRSPSPSSSTLPHPSRPGSILSPPTASELAASRSAAFSQARSAYRKSKSDRLMGGAAGYYSSIGREASASLRNHEAAAADALVSRQSRAGEVDLHSTIVQDAVRIARNETQAWWENEGREWSKTGKATETNLRIITGRGQHSQGGKGKIGPAVVKMLVREGWRVQVLEGVIDVKGRAKT